MKSIRKTKTFNASPEVIWEKWTTHEGLKSFFGASNKVELKLGGAYEIYFSMEAPKGLRGSEDCKVLGFVPNRMLSFTWNAPPTIPEIRNLGPSTFVVIFLNKVSDGTTNIEFEHLGWKEGEKWDETYQYFEQAWSTVLNWLEKSLKDK